MFGPAEEPIPPRACAAAPPGPANPALARMTPARAWVVLVRTVMRIPNSLQGGLSLLVSFSVPSHTKRPLCCVL